VDSFATSRRIFVPSTTLCLFARRTQAVNGRSKMNEYTHNDSGQGSSLGARDPLDVVFGTWLCFRELSRT